MSAFGGTNHNRERPKVADSRRSGDEIHPWLLNDDLRPFSVIRFDALARSVSDYTDTFSL
jgi:hypothetical protein